MLVILATRQRYGRHMSIFDSGGKFEIRNDSPLPL